jgi:hypothetical protein
MKNVVEIMHLKIENFLFLPLKSQDLGSILTMTQQKLQTVLCEKRTHHG